MSQKLQDSLAFRFMRWRLDVPGYDEQAEARIGRKMLETIRGTQKLDRAVVLAFDAVHTEEGQLDERNTHLYVTNGYVMELAHRHPASILFGCSVHPYRKDAVAELERCIKNGAVMVKWLPLTQNFDPSNEKCFAFYEALAHHKIPLLSHTGWENALPTLNRKVADPFLLLPAIQRGVTVIAAHCGTQSRPGETDFLPHWARMAKEHEHFYGDTAALNLPTRSYAYETILNDPVLRAKLVHGSDWPIISIPPATRLGGRAALELWAEDNWMRRDVLTKEQLGLDDAYWHRAGKVLGIG
jgi:predicted TIM-barrel fold metal-dependent hydrolase